MSEELKYSRTDLSEYENSKEVQKIISWVNGRKNVLEVGCHTADLGRILSSNGCIVTGIDHDKNAIEIAKKRIHNAEIINLNDFDFKKRISNKQFEVVICNQILEHLANPSLTLLELATLLKPNGICIIGLPNICNAKNRFDITFGKFEYSETGVMDNSHLHFYNQKTAIDLIENAGLIIEEYYSPWQVNPLKHIFDHIPILWRLSKLMNDKPSWCFKKKPNLTDTVMLFKCKSK